MENKLVVDPSPHISKWYSTFAIMIAMIMALLPTAISAVINFGMRSLYLILISVGTCYVLDIIMTYVREKKFFWYDISGAVTGFILALILPVNAPLYYPVIGAVIAVVIFKGCFGGIGRNIFNPSAAARVVLGLIFSGLTLDLFSGGALGSAQSPLAYYMLGNYSSITLRSLFMGSAPGAIGTASIFCVLIGGVCLLCFGIIDYVIPLTSVLTFVITIWAGVGVKAIIPYLFSGSFLFATFFMVTDPTTNPNTIWGKFFYGLLFGVVAGLFRVGFVLGETGVFVAVLIVNLFAAMLDKIFAPRPLGVRR